MSQIKDANENVQDVLTDNGGSIETGGNFDYEIALANETEVTEGTEEERSEVLLENVGTSGAASGTTVEISADEPIYITNLTVDEANDPEITFNGMNLLDDSSFMDQDNWTKITSAAHAYVFDLPKGKYIFSVKKKTESLCNQYVYFQTSSDDFVSKETVQLINKKWKYTGDNIVLTFTLRDNEKARIWRSIDQKYKGKNPETGDWYHDNEGNAMIYQYVNEIFDNVMLEKVGDYDESIEEYVAPIAQGTNEEITYITYNTFTLPYKEIQSLRIPTFDKYVNITNSENANMQVSYNVGGSLYDYIGKTPMNPTELYDWIGNGDGKDDGRGTDYTTIIQNKINELRDLKNGGTIYLGDGIYNITDSLILYSNIRVVGTGKTTINQTQNKHAVVWSGDNISMQDLTIKLSGSCDELENPDELESETNKRKIFGCIFVNCNNKDDDSSYNTWDSTYPENEQTTNCSLQNVTLKGTYYPSQDENGDLTMRDYRGCGLYADRMYFLYSNFENVKVRNLYAGIYGGSGANKYNIYETYCRYGVYGGGRNNMFDISGHSGYRKIDGVIVGATDYDCYITGHNNTIKSRVFDTQYNTTGKSVYFSPLSHENTYDVGSPAGSGWGGKPGNVADHGSINKCLGDLKLVPFAMGQRLRNITGYCEFRYTDGSTTNALAGAGIWGEISSTRKDDNGEWQKLDWANNGISLSGVCRYPNDSIESKDYDNNEAFILSTFEPTETNPFEITIDVQNRPITSNGNIWIQFDYRYVAKAFTVEFYNSEGNVLSAYTLSASDNRQTLWTTVPIPRMNRKISKIKITFTEALKIPDLKWQDAGNDTQETNYNPNGLVGIVNIGAISNRLYGRAFLGECGGSLYGNVNMMNGSTIKNLPTPTDDTDAASKGYVDAKISDIEAVLETIIAAQNSLADGQ